MGDWDPRRAPADEGLGVTFFRAVERFVEQRGFARNRQSDKVAVETRFQEGVEASL